ncbi:unnamed protein product [Lepidochelys olivacea]
MRQKLLPAMSCDSCQRLGDAMLAVLGLLVMGCVGLNTTSLALAAPETPCPASAPPPHPKIIIHVDTGSRSTASPARPCSPPAVPGAWGASSPPKASQRPCPGAHLSSRRPPADAPPGLEMEEPWAHPATPPSLGGHAAPRPAHHACICVCPLPQSPGWTPLPPSPGGVTSESWQGDFTGEGGPVYPPSPSFACWNRDGSGVLR